MKVHFLLRKRYSIQNVETFWDQVRNRTWKYYLSPAAFAAAAGAVYAAQQLYKQQKREGKVMEELVYTFDHRHISLVQVEVALRSALLEHVPQHPPFFWVIEGSHLHIFYVPLYQGKKKWANPVNFARFLRRKLKMVTSNVLS